MTKRSSFVIPPARADVAVIVDIVIAPPKFIDARLADEAGRIKLWASQQGNIAEKPAPIRLLALFKVFRPKDRECFCGRSMRNNECYCSAQASRINCFLT